MSWLGLERWWMINSPNSQGKGTAVGGRPLLLCDGSRKDYGTSGRDVDFATVHSSDAQLRPSRRLAPSPCVAAFCCVTDSQGNPRRFAGVEWAASLFRTGHGPSPPDHAKPVRGGPSVSSRNRCRQLEFEPTSLTRDQKPPRSNSTLWRGGLFARPRMEPTTVLGIESTA